MSVPSPYLNGFFAAARPVDRAKSDALLAAVPPTQTAASRADVPTDRSFSNEETKRCLGPLDRFPRLLECASANRPPNAEDRLHFQWLGLFYEAPVQDAFRLRLRLPGGRLQPFQLAGLAEITQRFASGQVVLNAQGGLDVPGVPVVSACQILSAAEDIGLSARCTGGDCVQAIRGGEYDVCDPESKRLPVYPLVRALEQAVTLGPAFADLPRPCEIVFHSGDDMTSDSTIDSLVLREAEDVMVPPGQEPRPVTESEFVLLVPGEDGFLLAPRAVVPGCLSLLEAWRSCGDRLNPEATTLAGFLKGLDPSTISTLLGKARQVSLPRSRGTDTREAPPGLVVPGARLLSGQLAALERCCGEHGWREIRLARRQLHAVAEDGAWSEATAILARVLSA